MGGILDPLNPAAQARARHFIICRDKWGDFSRPSRTNKSLRPENMLGYCSAKDVTLLGLESHHRMVAERPRPRWSNEYLALRPLRPSREDLSASFRLELLGRFITLWACRFTNFIAPNASGTAKSWSVRANGPVPNVRIAVPPNFPRSFPCSLPQVEVPQARRPSAATARVRAAAAAAEGSIGTNGAGGLETLKRENR